jgi:membrane protease YdiL (CAAX protease family)
MVVVFVRRGNEEDAEAVVPADLKTRRDVEIAVREAGPFVALADAPADPAIRQRLARALDTPSVRRWRRTRPWLLLGLFPIVALADLERELIALGTTGVAGRLAGDLVLGVFLVTEIARPIPRHPRTWAIASLAIAARYAYMITALCGHALPLFWLGVGLSLFASILALATMPTARALESDVREALALPAAKPATAPLPIAVPILASLALPAFTFATRSLAGLALSGVVFVVLGSAVPFLVKKTPAPERPWLERADAAFFGFSASIALTRLVHYTTIAFGEAMRCASPTTYDEIARPFFEKQAGEVGQHVTSARTELLLLAMAVVVVPIVEERVFRGTLQRALRSRTTAPRAIGATSVIFALAHLGVYRTALHQTFLVGLAFGAAYEEAGILAAITAHALYNGAQLL